VLVLGVDPLPAADDRQILKLRSTPGGLMGMDVRFDPPAGDEGRRVPPTLLIDTGFSGLIHLPRKAAEVLAEPGTTTRAGVSATAHRQRALDRVTLGSDLLLGRHRIERPSASVFTDEDGGRSGAVGTELLRRFIVTLDVPRRRIRLEEPQREAVPGP
jgi:predicted aspartyl protease